MKIKIVFTRSLGEKVVTYDARQIAKNFIRILKDEQKSNPDLSLLDVYYPEDLNGYIESILDKECDGNYFYEYDENVEKLIKETALEVDDLLTKYDC
jgi:hypothetical protein